MYDLQLIYPEDLPDYHLFCKAQGWRDAPALSPQEVLRMVHPKRNALVIEERPNVGRCYVAYGEAARVYLERLESMPVQEEGTRDAVQPIL